MSEETSPQTGADAKPRHFTPNVQLSAYGRLTRDPEAKTSERGHPYTRARIACNVTPAKREGDQQTWFVDVIAFRNQAAALAKCRQGQGVSVMGTLNMEERTKDGRTYQNFTVTADGVIAAATTRRTE
ncbi:MAG: single-stranded DNA-binding protein [Acidobacteria bacterium]|nr:single-stranded DNA-binding protein [Acidobacteriota bacterium]